ncbi:hypothetical protein [Streptomyces sp. NBC_00102]|uniref:hypothetical protein n=1 Tax=Streptomyces sp. NBC_00102 TaxID=2975652 RepID=UPI00224C8C37|nr:hypothetical protein [Streptomyces sp. NBC_00102]MCX5397715.1 hypothetical protein [Streptomyces sp. NBC_00102]
MIEFLVDLVVQSVLSLLFPRLGAKRRAKARDRAFAKGEEIVFEACVLGDRPYCRPVIVFLAVSSTALHRSPTEVKSVGRQAMPAGDIEIRRIRGRDRSDSRMVRSWWEVAECHDGEAGFLIACAPEDMRRLVVCLGGEAARAHRTPTG